MIRIATDLCPASAIDPLASLAILACFMGIVILALLFKNYHDRCLLYSEYQAQDRHAQSLARVQCKMHEDQVAREEWLKRKDLAEVPTTPGNLLALRKRGMQEA